MRPLIECHSKLTSIETVVKTILGCEVHILYLSTFLIGSATVLCISLTEISSYYAFAYLFSFSLSELLENPIAGILSELLLYSLFFGPSTKFWFE